MGVGELVRLCASAQVRKCLCTCGRGRGCFARADLDVRVFTNWHSVTASILAAAASAATTPGARPTVVGVDVGGVLVAMVEDGLTSAAEGLALREGEERVGDRARVAAAGAGRMSPGLGEEGKQRRKKVEVNIRSELFARRTSAESKKSNKHDGRRRQGHAPVVVPRVRGDAREASHQGGHARGRR